MPTALLYYRDADSLRDNVGADTPVNLLANFSDQVLEFDFPDNILEGVNFEYGNNVINIPIANSNGIKKINKQENGLKFLNMTVRGVFRNTGTTGLNADIAKLKKMAALPQVDNDNIYGVIGFYSPNAPEFSLDPNAVDSTKATIGFTLDGFSLGFSTPAIKRYGFQVKLSFGGVYVNPLP